MATRTRFAGAVPTPEPVPQPRLRPAVRALLVDPTERVLLVHFDLPDLTLWTAPGGGVEPAEVALDALRRELDEEVGLDLDATALAYGPPAHVWHRTLIAPGVADGWDGQVDDYWLLRCDAFEPRGSFTDEHLAAEGMTDLRWWTAAELRAAATSGTVFAPRDLPALLATLLRDGAPAVPVRLSR